MEQADYFEPNLFAPGALIETLCDAVEPTDESPSVWLPARVSRLVADHSGTQVEVMMLGEQGRYIVAESFVRPIPERQGGSPFNLSAATVGSQCVAWHAQRDEFCLAEIEQIGGGDTAIAPAQPRFCSR